MNIKRFMMMMALVMTFPLSSNVGATSDFNYSLSHMNLLYSNSPIDELIWSQFTDIVTVTCYHAVPEQTDDSPFITASGARINPQRPQRWIAISWDLRMKYSFGDSVYINGTQIYDGIWVIQDLMAPRWKNKIDLLVGVEDRLGKWENVQMKKL